MKNPCSFSFEEVVKLIKEAVTNSNGTIRKNDMLYYLMAKSGGGIGMSYKDANDIADFYYNTVRKKFKSNVNADNRLSNLQKQAAEQFFETGQVGFNENDFAVLQDIWKKQDKALTHSEKARYNEDAQNLIEKKDENYNNRVVEAFIWTKPLLSIAFNVASLRSNLAALFDRGVSEMFNYKDGKLNIDLRALSKAWNIDAQSRLAAKEVLKGGVPVTSIVNYENSEEAMSRVEEYSLNPTSKFKGAYLNTIKTMSKVGARVMNSIDAFGTINNANKIYYSLYKNYLKDNDASLSESQAAKIAYDHTYKIDKAKATQDAIKMYKDLGEFPSNPQKQKEFLESSRFKLAVEELARGNRDEHLMKLSYQYAKNDFWKKRMVVKSELGFGETGIGGVVAQAAQGISNALSNIIGSKTVSFKNNENKTIAGDLLKQRVFGFVNGASAFMEDKMEHFIVYGALKSYLLNRKRSGAEQEMMDYIDRRQRDMIVKGALGIVKASTFVALKALAESINCADLKGKQQFDVGDSFNNRAGFSICGQQIPIVMADQDRLNFDLFMALTEGEGSGSDYLAFVIQETLGNNRFVSPSSVNYIQDKMDNYSKYSESGNDAAATREKDKAARELSNVIAGYVNSFIPVPSRLFQETKKLVEPITGIGEAPQYKAEGLLDQFRHSMVSTMGLSDLYQLTGRENPVYDYLDRKVYDRTGANVTGNGIKYTKVDGMLATLHVRPPYTDRLTQVVATTENKDGVKVTTKRYLTDKEYYDLSKAKSELTKQYFDDNYDSLNNQDEIKSKAEIQKFFDGLYRYGQKYFEDADSYSKEGAKQYIESKLKKARSYKAHITTFQP